MTDAERELKRLARQVNDHLRRLEKNNLNIASSMYRQLESAKRMGADFLTENSLPRVSSKPGANIARQIEMYRNIADNTLSTDIRNVVKEYASQNGMSFNEALRDIEQNSYFESLVSMLQEFMTSTQVSYALQEWDSTPDNADFIRDLLNKHPEWYDVDPDAFERLANMNGLDPGDFVPGYNDPGEYIDYDMYDDYDDDPF